MQRIFAHTLDRSRIFYLFLFLIVGLFLSGSLMEMLSGALGWTDAANVWYIRLSVFLQGLLMFFFPAFTIAVWSDDKPLHFLSLRKRNDLFLLMMLAIIIFIVSSPMISLLTQWNKQMMLPGFMSSVEDWMRNTEDAAAQSTGILLGDRTTFGFFANLLLIAAFTAVSEEFFFRGVLQRSLEGLMKNGHAAVWVAAFVFSVLHLQFYGFLPRLALGVILGYLFLYSRNLWVPVIAHFFNNATVIVTTYFWGDTLFVKQMNNPQLSFTLSVYAVAGAAALVLLFMYYKRVASRAATSEK